MGAVLNNVYRDIRVTAAEGGQQAAEVDTLKAGNNPQVQRASAQAGIQGHLCLKGVGTLNNLLSPADKGVSRLSQGGSAGVAGKQCDAKFLFQPGYLLGQCGLTHMAGLSRKGKAFVLGYRQYIAYCVELHSVHLRTRLSDSTKKRRGFV